MLRIFLSLWLAITPAFAGSLTLLGAGGPAASGGFALTYQSSAGVAGGTVVNYGSLNYSSCTRVVVAVQWVASTATVSSITVGGSSLAHVASTNLFSSSTGIDIWESSASLGAGPGTVSVTYSAALGGFGSAVAVYCLTTTTPAASAGNTTVGTFGSGPVSVSLTVPSGGGGIAAATTTNSANLSAWTNAANDVTVSSGGNFFSFCHTTYSGAASVSYQWAGGGNTGLISGAAWGP
jgi:hypothetical protein